MNKPPEPRHGLHELRARRQDLHGRCRRLHERLAEVCEEFVLEGLTREHKQKALLRELQYLLDFYRDEDVWKDID